VLDVDYSPDKRFYAYSGWAHTVGLCNVYGSFELHENLVFNEDADRFCLFSVRFSPDNREIVGGANDAHLYVYDVERKQVVTRTLAHHDDINTAVFADASAQVIFTGSDDTLIKVWDRREMRGGVEDDAHRERAVPQRPSSYLIGHGEGITFIGASPNRAPRVRTHARTI
jgi:WD repeat-containing protein 23